MALRVRALLQLPDTLGDVNSNFCGNDTNGIEIRCSSETGGRIMNRAKRIGTNLMCLSASLVLGGSLLASPRQQNAPPPAADNSKTNQGDASQGAVTADRQKLNSSDQAISQNIRKSIMQDKTLSTYAHNVKIITQDGKVTLKGPVRSDDEKANVEAKATAVAGVGNVMNQLTVAAGNGNNQ
jgi:hyperosmotically inducible protein